MPLPLVTPGAAVLFYVALDSTYNVVSANLSSPQTTELFAGARAETLWKHVKRADWQVGLYGVLGAMLANAETPGAWVWPIAGVALSGVIMHWSYWKALTDGQAAAGQTGSRSRAAWGA
jgi:hypothetical protein